MLAHYCGFTKFDVWNLTIPQLERYLVHCHKHVKFEFEASANSIANAIGKLFGGGDGKGGSDDSEYQEATEDDINLLAQILGGGM